MTKFVESSGEYLQAAALRGVTADLFQSEPDQRVVITGIAAITPYGNIRQTWDGMMNWYSPVTTIDTGNFYTRLAATLPTDYDPVQLLPKEDTKQLSRLGAIYTLAAREAGQLAGLVDEQGHMRYTGKLRELGLHPYRVGGWIGSGVSETFNMIDVYNSVHRGQTADDPDSRLTPAQLAANSRRLDLTLALSCFPEEHLGDMLRLTQAMGHSGMTAEACATGASNIVEAVLAIRRGRLKVAFGGGFEDALYKHPEVLHALFSSSVRTLSRRNDDPSRASRPCDVDRDGFVPASGGGLLVLESEKFARGRGANILAEVFGVAKGSDGYSKTMLNPNRVADVMAEALWDPEAGALRCPDLILLHATSTASGDSAEAEAVKTVFGTDTREIYLSALKSFYGHLLGGAGSANVVMGVMMLQKGIVLGMMNLDNPDPKILALGGMNFIRGEHLKLRPERILANAFGFGGNNAVLEIGRYIP